jgi:hypothetical protein
MKNKIFKKKLEANQNFGKNQPILAFNEDNYQSHTNVTRIIEILCSGIKINDVYGASKVLTMLPNGVTISGLNLVFLRVSL